MNILVLNTDNSGGVGYFRILAPHLYINEPDIHVDIRLLNDHSLPLFLDSFIKKYDVIVYNKTSIQGNNFERFKKICKKHDIKVVFDIDDYFILDHTHTSYKLNKLNNSKEIIIDHLKNADVVTTTTELFADKLKEFNKNIVVLPNAINIKEYQWQYNKIQSDKIRFLWGGGVAHKADLNLLKEDIKKMDKTFREKAQLFLCGFDLRVRQKDGTYKKDNYQSSPWSHFEHLFNNDVKYISYEYYKYLKESSNFDNDDNFGRNEEFINEFYQRRHTKPVNLFGTMYNECDVAIAPLNKIPFNYYKSQLKVIEAGCKKCPVIVSNYGPYTLDNINNRLGFVIDNDNEWYEKMKYYVDNPNAIKDHGEANHEHFLNNYEMGVVNKKRLELYKSLKR